MRIGLVADSHDRLPVLESLAGEFAKRGAELILHAGDYCSPFSLVPFRESLIPLVGVFGRNDGDREGLRTAAEKGVAAELYEAPHSMELDGRRILLVHDVGDVAVHSLGEHSIVVHGGSHRAETATSGDTLLINPGEACGWLYGVPSAAMVDLTTLQVEFFTYDGEEWRS